MKTFGIGLLVAVLFYGTWGLWHQIVTKRNKAVAIVLAAILIVMALTNPDEATCRTAAGERYLGRINLGVASIISMRPTREKELQDIASWERAHPPKPGDLVSQEMRPPDLKWDFGLLGQVF